MKAVQIGILAALLVCAGLLFKVYRGQQAQAPAPAAQAQPAPATSEPVPQAAPVAPTPAPAAEATGANTPSAAEPAALKKPSPSRSAKKSQGIAGGYRPPELLTTGADGAPAASQAPTPEQPQVAAAPEPQPALNPPAGTPVAPPEPRQPHRVTIPAGTVVTIRLGETVSSQKNQPGDTFSGTLDQALIVDGFAIAERGSRIQGKVVDAQQAGRVKGVAQLALQLTKIHTADGQDVAVSTERFAKEGPTSHGEDAKKVGIGAALGAAIGAIAGGGKGAAVGAGVGGAAGAGTVAATRGKQVELPVETRLTFRLQEPVTVTERLR